MGGGHWGERVGLGSGKAVQSAVQTSAAQEAITVEFTDNQVRRGDVSPLARRRVALTSTLALASVFMTTTRSSTAAATPRCRVALRSSRHSSACLCRACQKAPAAHPREIRATLTRSPAADSSCGPLRALQVRYTVAIHHAPQYHILRHWPFYRPESNHLK